MLAAGHIIVPSIKDPWARCRQGFMDKKFGGSEVDGNKRPTGDGELRVGCKSIR